MKIMLVKFKMIERNADIIQYEYSRGNGALDGIISYANHSKETVVTKPCAQDNGNENNLRSTIQIFDRCIVPHLYAQRTVMT